ncbi:hypothetical protein ACFWIB_42565 [Streptomyces sp. NPDC127051]|uniref:hypothetical protein n=1 Tax=Streptomyces sp. NPDC127051 TaxID=3347119 RepID=UPI00365F8086
MMRVDKVAVTCGVLLTTVASATAYGIAPWLTGVPAVLLSALASPSIRERVVRLARTVVTYTAILTLPRGPAEVIDLLYRGCPHSRVRLLRRDLLCTAGALRGELEDPAGHSTDPHPYMSRGTFTFLFALDDPAVWKPRRAAISSATSAMSQRASALPAFVPPPGARDVYTDIATYTLAAAFQIVFGCPPTSEELRSLQPGFNDINDLVKNRTWRPDTPARRRAWEETGRLVDVHLDDPRFLFHQHPDFAALSHAARVDIVGADLLQSITFQTADLFGHLLWYRHHHPQVLQPQILRL